MFLRSVGTVESSISAISVLVRTFPFPAADLRSQSKWNALPFVAKIDDTFLGGDVVELLSTLAPESFE